MYNIHYIDILLTFMIDVGAEDDVKVDVETDLKKNYSVLHKPTVFR
jgi:hypothetical protein